MRNIILLFLFFMGFSALAQEPDFAVKAEVVKNIKISASARDSYVVPTNEIWHVELTDGTKWKNDGGSGWVEETGSGLQSTDIDTFAELDAIVSDKSLAKLEDPQTFTGAKTFQDRTYFPNIEFTEITSLPLNSGIGTSSSRLQFRDATGNQPFSFNGDNLTAVRTYILPDTPGTVALTSNIPDNTNFVDLTSDQTNITGNKIFDELRVLDNGIGSFSNALEVSVPGGLNQSAFPHFIVDVDENEPGSSKINFLIDIGVPTYRVLEATASDLTYNGTSLLSGGGDVIAANSLTDNRLVRGDGGLKGVQTSQVVLDDTGQMSGLSRLEMGGFFINGGSSIFGVFEGVSGQRWQRQVISGKLQFAYQLTPSTTWSGAYQTYYSMDPSGTPTDPTDLIPKAYADANYGNSWIGTATSNLNMSGFNITGAQLVTANSGYGTKGGSFGNLNADNFGITPDDTSVGSGELSLQWNWTSQEWRIGANKIITDADAKISSDITGYGAGVTATDNIVVWDYDVNPTEPTAGTNDVVIGINTPLIDVIPTATWDTNNGAVTLTGTHGVDDRTIDEPTITLSGAKPRYSLLVWINRASAPILAGTGLTFNPLPGTTAFAADTEMALYLEVGLDGTTIDYFYYER